MRLVSQILTESEMGLVVKNDGHGGMSISLPREGTYTGNVCGICGDFNGNKEDDWRIGPFAGCIEGTNDGGEMVGFGG